MIREAKSSAVPPSLSSHKKYDGADVVEQLMADHHGKCYLCELYVKQFYQVEHLKSQDNNTDLIFDWGNLFLSDGYCNGKKGSFFDQIMNPNQNNIEEIIKQHIDSINRKAVFNTTDTSIEAQKTVELLNRLYNGTKYPRLRSNREFEFYKEVERIVNSFNITVLQYLSNPIPQNEQAVRDELSIDKELLGFKYWIIKDNPQLFAVFKDDIIWNKQ